MVFQELGIGAFTRRADVAGVGEDRCRAGLAAKHGTHLAVILLESTVEGFGHVRLDLGFKKNDPTEAWGQSAGWEVM